MELHPEDLCEICWRPNIVWSVDSKVWNYLTEKFTQFGREIILCPICFVKIAIKAGINVAWTLEADKDSREYHKIEVL